MCVLSSYEKVYDHHYHSFTIVYDPPGLVTFVFPLECASPNAKDWHHIPVQTGYSYTVALKALHFLTQPTPTLARLVHTQPHVGIFYGKNKQ